MSAVRVARAATGRRVVVKFAGAYHGHADMFLVSAGSGAATFGVPDSPGVTPGAVADTAIARFNDLDSVDRCFADADGGVAAVIVEPVVGNMGCVPPEPGFLEGLRDRCTRSGAVLIFDEVMSGFRVARGGAAERYGVTPDLVTLGKIAGGGVPLAAFGGQWSLMQQVAPSGPVYQAGTYAAHPLAIAAGLATMDAIDADPVSLRHARGPRRASPARVGGGRPRRRGSRGGAARRFDVDGVLHHRAHPLVGRCRGRGPGGVRPLLQGDAGAGHPASAVGVRIGVPLHRARRARDRPHRGGRTTGISRGAGMNDRFLRACRRQAVDRTPLWIMRQAGRYLPEYRAVRERVSFLTLCKTPELAVEVSLQPLRRFPLDAAIIFSDILLPLEALGCRMTFNPGPKLEEPVRTRAQVEALQQRPAAEAAPFVAQAIRMLRQELDGRTPVIGFCGAPFTLAAYLVQGEGKEGFGAVKTMLYQDPVVLEHLLAEADRDDDRLPAPAGAGRRAGRADLRFVGRAARARAVRSASRCAGCARSLPACAIWTCR